MAEDEKTYDFSTMCRHCEKETIEPIPATVTGCVPEYVSGVFLYNGPAITKIGDTEYRHCFDPLAMIQKVTVSSSGCYYQSRYLQSGTFTRNTSAGTITVAEFGTGAQTSPGTGGFLSKMRKMADAEALMSDNAGVSITTIAGNHYAIGDTPFLHHLDLQTLLTKEKRSLYKELGLVNQSPHPVLADDGHSYGLGQTVGIMGPRYNIVCFPKDGSAARVVARVAPRWRMSPCFMHSIGITKNYLVLLEQPLAMSLMDVVTEMMKSAPFIDCIKWHDEKVLVHVLDMRTWKPVKQKFLLKPLFMIHFANCYEDDDGKIVVDFPSYPGANMLKEMYIDKLRTVQGAAAKEMIKTFNNIMTRAVLPLSDKNTEEIPVDTSDLSSCPLENPVVNPDYRRRRHRYIYGSGQNAEARNYGQVTKLDVETGQVKTFYEEGLYTGELVFIPRPGSQVEDDGVVVVVCVVSDHLQFGCLVLLDASSFTEVARVSYTPAATVPVPVHGIFLPTTAEASH